MEFPEKENSELNWKNGKKPSFGSDFSPFGPNSDQQFFFQKSGFINQYTSYQLSSCAISEKN